MQKDQKPEKPLKIIGNSVKIKIGNIANIPAKVDTGATVSSIWASNIRLTPDNQLEFSLFAPGHQLYTGERLITKEYKVRNIRNSTGQESIRYMVALSTSIKGRRIRITYTLADRSRNDFPVLIGRRALKGKFLVDVSRLDVKYAPRPVDGLLNKELQSDPQKFHQKYMQGASHIRPMAVREYYYRHFNKLSPDKQFHFATRIKNYFHSDDFRDYFASHMPSQDLARILEDNDFSHVNKVDLRRPYFEKYDHLYAIDAALFRIHHLLHEYNVDLRQQFLGLIPLERLHSLADALMDDDGAILALSTWAVNVICLTEALFPRGKNVVRILAQKSLQFDPAAADPLLLIYLYTHIILCDSNFYTRPVAELDLARQMLDRCAEIISQDFTSLILDVKIEFLVCANMCQIDYPDLRARIAAECQSNLSFNNYLVDLRRPQSYHTLDGAEHTNVLYIMSGLDGGQK